MAESTTISIRVDPEIKKQCEALYEELGLNLTTAINIFLRQSLRTGGLPFEVKAFAFKKSLPPKTESEKAEIAEPEGEEYPNVETALQELKRYITTTD